MSKLPGIESATARNRIRRQKSGVEREEGRDYWIEMKIR